MKCKSCGKTAGRHASDCPMFSKGIAQAMGVVRKPWKYGSATVTHLGGGSSATVHQAVSHKPGTWALKPKSKLTSAITHPDYPTRVTEVTSGGGLTRMGKLTAGAGVTGGALGGGGIVAHKKKVSKLMDPYGIEKKQKQGPSAGRLVTGAAFPGWHGAIAGKPGHYRKLKAASTEVAGSMVVPMVGGGVGTAIAHDQGWLKKQPKKKVSKAWDYAPGTSKKKKAAYVTGATAGVAAAGVGGYKAGGAIGLHGLKAGVKTKSFKTGAAIGGAGILNNHLLTERAKKKGVLVKKSMSASAFGVDHA